MAWGFVTELSPADFDGEALRRDGALVVLFLASWCPFCRRFQPAFETAAKKSNVPWAVADVSDDDSILWDTFKIDTVPTVVVFKDGKAVLRRDGVRGQGLSESDVKEIMNKMKSPSAATGG